MNKNYKNQLKKLALLMVMLLFGLTTAYSQVQLKVTIECNGKVVVRDQNSLAVVTTIVGPVVESTITTLVAGQAITIQTEPGDIVPFQVQGYEVVKWVRSNAYPTADPNSATYTTISKGDPGFASFINFTMGGNNTTREVIVSFDIKDPNITMDPISSINTVTNTPVIIPVKVEYDPSDLIDYSAVYSNDIYVDALITTSLAGGFPTGATITKVSLDGGATNLLTGDYIVAGMDEIFLSDVLGMLSPALLMDEDGKTLNWEITVSGVSDEITIPVEVSSVGYNDFDVCHTVFATQNFNVTFLDATIAPIANFETCWNVPYDFEYAITYPTIANVDNRVKNDAVVQLDVPLNAGTSIDIYLDNSLVTTYSLTSPYSTFYLSAMIAGDANPTVPNAAQAALQGHVGTDTWRFEIDDLQPGTYNVGVTNFAYLESEAYNYASESFEVVVHPEPAVGFSFDGVLAGTGDSFEYCYDADITVTLSNIWSGTAPFDIEWLVDDGIAPVTYTFTGGLNGVLYGPSTYAVGTYTITMNSIVDANGCEPSDYSPWLAYLTVHPEPTLDITVVDNQSTPYTAPYEFCFDGEFGIAIVGDDGTGPWNFDYKIVGPNSFLDLGSLSGTSGLVWIDLAGTYDPGTYTFSIEALSDAKCTATNLAGYTFDVEVLPEPELEILVDGVNAHGMSLEFCYSDNIQIDMAGTVGTAPWTATWEVTGPSGFYDSDVMSGTSGTWNYDLSLFPVGSYTLTITSLTDDKGCMATQATLDSYEFYIEIHPEPEVTAIDIVYSLSDDLSSPVSVDGNLIDGYELCINDNDPYYYLGVASLTAGDALEIEFANPFFLDETSVPAGFYAYWAARGVDGGVYGDWRDLMWDIINGNAPMFTLVFDGTDYFLYDGLQGAPSALRINGDYHPGAYTFEGSVKSAEGCFSDVSVDILFLDDPNANAGADPICVTEATYQLEAVFSVIGSTGEWTQTGGTGTANFASTTSPTTTVTVDVAGEYEFTWTETNGICEDSDVVVVTFLKGTLADAYNFNAMPDIDAVSDVPVVMLMQYNLPAPDNTADAGIIMDGIVRLSSGTWPIGATVVEVERRQAVTSTWFPVVDGDLGGKDFVFLSDLIGINNPLFNNVNPTYPWVITIDGIDGGTYETEVLLVTYITKPADLDTDCYAVLDSEDFILTFGDALVTTPADCVETCYDPVEQMHDLEFDISIAYPTINNVDVDDEITLDALLTITGGNNFNDVAVYWGYNGAASNLSSFNFDGVSSVYLSQIVGGSPTPLSGHSGTDVWSIRIVGLNPGYYDLNVEAIALIDLYIGTQIANNTGVDLPQVQPGDFDEFEYMYAEDDFCLNVVGSLEVSIDPIDNIETVTGAPVVVDFAVNYGNISAENIDNSVLADALISFAGALPVNAEIVELKLGTQIIATNYSLANASEVLLSDVVVSGGFPAPNPLNGQADNSTDTWTAVFAGIDAPGTYTVTVQGIAYVDYATCFSVTAEEEFTVTWENMEIVAAFENNYCLGDVVEDVVFNVNYPAISGNPASITTDAMLSVSNPFPDGAVISWSYSDSNGGSSSGNYTVVGSTSEINLSTIVGPPAPTPLNGHDLLNVTWTFDFSGLGLGLYYFDIVPLATLDSQDYPLVFDNYEAGDVYFYVYPYPDPAITGDSPVFSGSTNTYAVDNDIVDFTDIFAPEFWYYYLPDPIYGGAVTHTATTLEIEGPDGANCSAIEGEAVYAAVEFCYDGVLTFDWAYDSDDSDEYDFLVIQETAAGTVTIVYNANAPASGSETLSISAGDYIEFKVVSEDCIVGPGYATISNWNFEIEGTITNGTYFWEITNVDALSGNPLDVAFVDGVYYTPDVDIETAWPFTGTYDLVVTVENCGPCVGVYTKTITVEPNQLVGQVKYYNPQESPMPSPFKTNYDGMEIPDYFYVLLLDQYQYDDLMVGGLQKEYLGYEGDLDFYLREALTYGGPAPVKSSYPPSSFYTEFLKVEEYYGDNGHPLLTDEVYEAAFAFEYNLDPTETYYVLVWDGGYWDEYINVGNLIGAGELGKAWTWNKWGGVNATDALLIAHMGVGNINTTITKDWIGTPDGSLMYNTFAMDVADVNKSGGKTTGLDALLTSRRSIGLIQKFPNEKPNFAVAGIFVDENDFNTNNTFGVELPEAFEKPDVIDWYTFNDVTYQWSTWATQHWYGKDLAALPGTVSPTFLLGNHYLNIYYDAVGDINASYQPVYGYTGTKAAPAMELYYEDVLAVNKGEEVTIPVTIDNFAELGALSLGMTYRNDLVEVIATNYSEDFAYFDHEAGTVNIAWANLEGIAFEADEAIATITVRVLADFDASVALFELTDFTELADRNAKVLEGVNLKSKSITTDLTQAAGAFAASNHPNPFNEQTTISYTLPEAGAVSLVVYNRMGQVVKTMVNQYQDAGVYQVNVNSTDLSGPGVYYYKLEVKGESNDFSSTNSMILVR